MRGLAIVLCVLASGALADDRRSGFWDMSEDTRAMQSDDMANPGMLAVLQGQTLWQTAPTSDAPTCAGCHDAPESLRGVAARYPAYDAASGTAVDLSARVNLCRTRHQATAPLPPEDPQLLALVTLIGLQSRGMPISPDPDPRLDPWRVRGAALFDQRLGQLNLSCAQCHDDHAGGHLGSSPIPQAHPNGYPIYRLEWQAMGSLQRRFRNCMAGVRSTPFDYGADEFVALETFLMSRAAGMTVETPGVRP